MKKWKESIQGNVYCFYSNDKFLQLMEKINNTPEKRIHQGYQSVLKPFLIALILVGNPQWFSMNTEKKLLFNEWNEKIDIQENKQIIEEAIKKTLFGLTSLDKLPQIIHYPNKDIKNVPKSIDINPKSIKENEPVDWIILILWERKFFIEPVLGKIESLHLTNESLEIETTYINRKYSKKQKLPELCYRLWNTQKWKGEKPGFFWVTITEI